MFILRNYRILTAGSATVTKVGRPQNGANT